MAPNSEHNSPALQNVSAPNPQQPFPGAFSPASAPPTRRTVMEMPVPLPTSSFIYRVDGSYSENAIRVFGVWSAQLQQQLHARSAHPNTYDLAAMRRELLLEACQKYDIFYVVMHRIFCTWTRDRNAAYALLQPYIPNVIDNGFEALSLLLSSNGHLSPLNNGWFADFPVKSFDCFIPSPIMDNITRSIMAFLNAFAARWDEFRAHVRSRGFPILVWELSHTLKCTSPIAQYVIFNLSRRLLVPHNGPFEQSFKRLFARDWDFELSAATRRLPYQQVQNHRNALSRSYLDLVENYRSEILQTSSAFGTPQSHHVALGNTPATPQISPTALHPIVLCNSTVVHNTAAQSAPNPSNPIAQSRAPSHLTQGSSSNSPKIIQGETTLGSQSPAQNTPLTQHAQSPAPVAQSQPPTGPTSTIPPTQNLETFFGPEPGQLNRQIPESEYPKSIYDISSLRVGLHLARQRSPRRLPLKFTGARFYQYVDSLVVQPTTLEVTRDLAKIKFTLSDEQVKNLPVAQSEFNICSLPVVRVDNNFRRFRVRVCQIPSDRPAMDEARWVVRNTFWPEQIHMSINGKPCLLSRKQHFHVDLPAEITTDVKSGGNELRVSLPSLSKNETEHDYCIAVEQIIIQDYTSVWQGVNNNPHVSVETTQGKIKDMLGPHIDGEIALVGRTSNISVCDPMSAKICNTPVHGADCKHLECFDLENWLRSRPTKPGSSHSEPCLVDCWGCPVCGADARPSQLRVCDFFVNVSQRLRETGHSETRFIAVDDKGQWQPLVETASYFRRDPVSPTRGRQHQIIDILDD